MDENLLEALKKIHGKNRLLWIIVLIDIFLFGLLVLFFKYYSFPENPVSWNFKSVNDLSLIVIIGVLVLIMVLKRSYLVPEKLIRKAQIKRKYPIHEKLISFQDKHGEDIELLSGIMILLRRYYFVVWSLINLIALIGFLLFIVSNQIRPFLIYGVVALYALIINFPFFSIVERSYYKIMNQD